MFFNQQHHRYTWLGSAALLLALSPLSKADVSTASGLDRQQHIDSIASLNANRDSHSNLRCWQYGKLLFEENQLKAKKLSDKQNMLVFENESGSQARELYVIDTGSATCVYEQL